VNLLYRAMLSWTAVAIMFIATASLFGQQTADISGSYEFEHEDEFIQLNIDNGRLDGYISKLGDETSDRGTPLTYFFKKAKTQGMHVTFSTNQVHGLWYSFDGVVVRGPARMREEAGYYVLQGRMTTHHVDFEKHDAPEQRTVSFRSRRGNT
jgi:hypothetical protein